MAGLNLPLAFAIGGVSAAALYAGIRNPQGGIAGVFQGVIKGALPAGQTATSGAEAASFALGGGSSSGGGAAVQTAAYGQSTSSLTSSGGAGGGGTGAPGMVTQAARWLGTPYAWGGGGINGPSEGFAQGLGTVGFDCSGLTQFAAYHALGVKLGRTTAIQCRQGSAVALSPMSAWAVGDLVFTDANGHVGIYAGGGQVINAPHTGAVVRYESCTNSYWIPTAVRRLTAAATPKATPSRGLTA